MFRNRKADMPGCSIKEMEKTCVELGDKLGGKLGPIVAKHEELILKYYRHVRQQAMQSFSAARTVAGIGFSILAATLAYVLIFDALTRLGKATAPAASMSVTVATVGIISGALIEFIAAVNLWLYSRGARQFSAFHICLERTHRYLLAYTIADQLQTNKDAAIRDLMCIMANAPMIGHLAADGGTSEPNERGSAQLAAVSAEFPKAQAG